MIEIKKVSKVFGKNDKAIIALNEVDLNIEEGKFYAIIGKSGSGKSTLLNIIGALDRPSSGEVIVDGNNISQYSEKRLAQYRNEQIGYVFQSFYLEPTYSVEDNIALPLLIKGESGKNRREKVAQLIEKMHLEDIKDKKAKELSGGQKQRVSLARALISNPNIILADEPTGNLDNVNGKEVVMILRELADAGKTVIMVTHNEFDTLFADKVVMIDAGKLVIK